MWSFVGFYFFPEIAIICLLNDNIGILSFQIKYCEVFGNVRNCRTKQLRLLKKCHILVLVCPRKTICCIAANNLQYQICPVPVRSWVPFISFWRQKGFQHVAAQAVLNTNVLIAGRSLVFICKMEAKLVLTFRAKSKG